MKTRIKNYLSITKKEWNGLVVFVVLIILVVAAPYVYQMLRKDNVLNLKDFDTAVVRLNKIEKQKPGSNNSGSDDKIAHPVMFSFNPNNLTIEQWKQLGLSEHQANVIKHYESKGGTFHSKEDVKKIYSITPEDYKKLEPYINIPEQAEYTSKKAKPGVMIELNTADSAKLTEVRGIGSSFATRIVRYRKQLGGFIRKEQLKEIYGIDSVKYAEIKNGISVNPNLLTKLNINTISFAQLRLFPLPAVINR